MIHIGSGKEKAQKASEKRKRRKTPTEKRAAIEQRRQELAKQEREWQERKATLEAQWKKEEIEKKEAEKHSAAGRKLAAAENLVSDTIHTKNENDAKQIQDNLDQARVVYHVMSAKIKGKGVDREKKT